MSESHAFEVGSELALAIEVAGRRWAVGAQGHDISIPLRFNEAQPTFFGGAVASEQPLSAGSFIGDVRQGGSCNCSIHTLAPHCNGTHTECVGHITHERLSVRDRAQDGGRLAAHRIFWGLPPGSTAAGMATRKHATITEMAFIDSAIADGAYLLNLQVAPFMIDAAPSRPILLPLSAV